MNNKPRSAREFNHFLTILSLLYVLCGYFLCGNSPAQNFTTLKPGIEYAEVTKEISGLKVNMNLLRLDLTKVRLDVAHAMDAAIGTEKTSSIATRHGAFAAINAGFFRLDNSIWAGDPAGALVIDGVPWSDSSNNRIAIFITNTPKQTAVNFAHLYYSFWVRFGTNLEQEASIFPISGINTERKDNQLIWFTNRFHRTTMTNPDGVEIVVKKGRIVAIYDSKGSIDIPTDADVLSASGEVRKRVLLFAKLGTRVSFMGPGPYDDGYKLQRQAEDITNGVPQLIKDGKVDITWEQEKTTKSFVETRHPRTAVAKLKDGKFLMITVDGRSESSGGIGLYDLANYLLSLGAIDAMNLDGGGSSTMFVDGKVVNHPSDKEGERKVSDALLVTPRTSINKAKH
jgi:exopolysaccharide biosynthesis protein